MFRKILIVEDIDSITIGITSLLEKNFNAEIHNSKYCDEAFLKIKRSIKEKSPFDLLITDLSFKKDPKKNGSLNTGEMLIKRLTEEGIEIKTIIYSVEDQPFMLHSLLSEKQVHGYVIKGRESSNELIDAINNVYNDEIYISAHLSGLLKQKHLFEIDQYDIEILKLLSEGLTQEDISRLFKKKAYPSPSTSSIEKKINKLKNMLKAQTSIHLISIAKDMRII